MNEFTRGQNVQISLHLKKNMAKSDIEPKQITKFSKNEDGTTERPSSIHSSDRMIILNNFCFVVIHSFDSIKIYDYCFIFFFRYEALSDINLNQLLFSSILENTIINNGKVVERLE